MKTFGIGLHKTGTTTLYKCFEILNLNPCSERKSSPLIHEWKKNNYVHIFKLVDSFNSFEDSPWLLPDFYKILDENFPNNNFILTVRNQDNWWKSMFNWVKFKTGMDNRTIKTTHEIVYGNEFNETQYKFRYNLHNNSVVDYFAKNNNFLVVDWESGDGWEKICSFLKLPVPHVVFPHMNKHFGNGQYGNL